MSKKIIYLAGPITGVTGYKKKFHEAYQLYKGRGHTVLNPAMLPEGLTQADYMRICMAMIEAADVVVMLPGWGKSEGATIEQLYALKIGKDVLDWKEPE